MAVNMTTEKIARSAPAPFEFYKAVYQTELTGKRAGSLFELAEVVRTIDGMSIFHHMFHSLIDAHLAPSEFSNDFAFWIADALKDEALAERLANISMTDADNVDALREKVLEVLDDITGDLTAPSGLEFHFMKSTLVAFPIGRAARNFEEFKQGIESLDPKSIFYHLYVSKIVEEKRENDFSAWLRCVGESDLADCYSTLEPSDCRDLSELKGRLISKLRRLA